MAIKDLVDHIQTTYPPSDGFPQLSDTPRIDDERQVETDLQWPESLPEIERLPPPEWLRHGEGDQLEEDELPSLESEPNVLRGPQPGNPDMLAFYLPFHFYLSHWGIYVRASSLLAIGSMLASASGRPTREFINLAYQILLQHEKFHFYTEVACSRAEIASRSSLYRSYFAHGRATALEEALANAQSLQRSLKSESSTIKDAIETWMRSQGPGYRDFEPWVSRPNFYRGRRLLTDVMIGQVSGAGALGPTAFLYYQLSRYQAPIYLIRDSALIGTVRPFPKDYGIRIMVHTDEHPPPHVHLLYDNYRKETRLKWPSLNPVKGNPSISTSVMKNVKSYLNRYGPKIEMKVHRVFGVGA